ncbi:peptide chain release factor N(5)-glutamine methyltransferase [Anaerococcus sp. AGMB00486]|uniref:Release factor glutamine methyltransferase n=2 Tax=Anaerococcus TaxID=165779 RepID=A0ABX2NBB8_9FIRM|nr:MULTISPECIES: peptide chain release factor N(5)-glutamine methyltransferase [Anaerococcus]MSS78195.1 peptide chain release factor N(5)-glutamine methyltransferase [Anaerococcus porci]NVF11953.1 peptide chain release factor N(5)-glutamine methyltransferase [Anaerococcus faecalis]
MKVRCFLEKYGNDAALILSYLLDTNKNNLYLYPEKELSKEIENELIKILKKIQKGYPLQYAIGKWNFYGLDLYVDKRALIPRFETEILVEEILKEPFKKEKILDIGCGSGAISLALAKKLEKSRIIGCDISKDALELSNLNKSKLKLNNVEFIYSDLFSNIDEKFDLIVSNPPYINKDDYENLEEKLYYEPKNALYGGEDGLYFYRQIISKAKYFLNKNGKIYLEIGYNQKNPLIQLLKDEGYKNIKAIKDYNDFDRILSSNI